MSLKRKQSAVNDSHRQLHQPYKEDTPSIVVGMHKSFSESFYQILTPCNIDSASKPASIARRTVSGNSKTLAVKHAKKVARKAM